MIIVGWPQKDLHGHRAEVGPEKTGLQFSMFGLLESCSNSLEPLIESYPTTRPPDWVSVPWMILERLEYMFPRQEPRMGHCNSAER